MGFKTLNSNRVFRSGSRTVEYIEEFLVLGIEPRA
jgi:hypothetical protein